MRQLVGLRKLLAQDSVDSPDSLDSLRATTQILAVSIDNHADSLELIKLLEEDGTPVDFPLLEDKNHAVIDRYGLLNPQGRGIPHPATYIIDKHGVVRWKFVEVDYAVRPTNEAIVAELKTLR